MPNHVDHLFGKINRGLVNICVEYTLHLELRVPLVVRRQARRSMEVSESASPSV